MTDGETDISSMFPRRSAQGKVVPAPSVLVSSLALWAGCVQGTSKDIGQCGPSE